MAEARCIECGKKLDSREIGRADCHNCRSHEGTLSDLDIAIMANGDSPARIEE